MSERTIAARAAQLVDAYLRGYLSQPGKPALGLDELADLAHAAREVAEREMEEQRAAPAACCGQS